MMTNSTMVEPIDIQFAEFYNKYLATGKIFTPKDILGEPPVIPDSPDTDARLEAYEEYAEYSRQYRILEEKINNLPKREA